MEKIIASALQNAKPTLENMLKVVNSSANPKVVTELLLGIYERPAIAPECVAQLDERCDVKFVDYDDMAETVKYSYRSVSYTYHWVPKTDAVVAVDLSNCVSTKTFDDDAAKEVGMDYKTFKETYHRIKMIKEVSDKTHHDVMTLTRWNTGSYR